MSEQNDLSGRVSLETTDFVTGISILNRQLRIAESGFRASAATMGDWDKTSAGLEMRSKNLNGQIDLQKTKLAFLTREYEKVVKEKGNDSRAAEELQIKINKQNEVLGKMESELKDNKVALEKMGQESATAAGKVDDLGKKSETTARKSDDFKKTLKDLGSALKEVGKIALGVVAAVAAIGGAVIKLVLDNAAAADSLMEMSDKTGISVQKLQELSYVGKQVGVDTVTMTGSMARMIRNMGTAREGTGAAADAFKLLGVNVVDSNGQLRDSQTVFQEAIDALAKMPNETERDAAAMAIFGKNAQELNPLIKAGADNIAKMTDEAHKNGAVMSDEAVKGLADFNDTLDGLKAGLAGTAGTLAAGFLPAFQGIAGKAQGYLSQLVEIVKSSNGDLGSAAGGIAGLITQIVTDAVSAAPNLLKGGLGIIQGLIKGILGNIPVLIPAIIQMVMMLVQFILANIPMLLQAAIEIVIAIANGISTALPQLIPAIVQAVVTIVMTLLQNLPMLIEAALKLIIALAQGLVAALPVLIQALPGIMTALVQGIITLLPMILVAAVQLITTLAFGLVQNLPLLIQSLAAVIQGIIDVFVKTDWGKIGKDLVKGLEDGFMAQWEKFRENVIAGFNAMIDFIKGLLGIASPSRVFAGIGMNMAAGLGVGFSREMANVQRQISGLMGGGFGLMPAFAGTGVAQSYDQSQRYAFYGPVYLQGAAGQSLGEEVKARRW